jgi:hypothetical protein
MDCRVRGCGRESEGEKDASQCAQDSTGHGGADGQQEARLVPGAEERDEDAGEAAGGEGEG